MFRKFMGMRSGGQEQVPAPVQDEIVEAFACKVEDMKDGEMRMIDIGETKALLVRDQGEFHAVGPKCTHFGAPLNKGAYCNGRVRCPWHGACFNIKTGDIEDFPGFDSIPKHEVVIANGEVTIRAEKKSLENFRRVKPMAKRGDDTRIFVIVGGGAAGASCSETLRQEGFKGRIILVNQEEHLPYDRTMLSKMPDSKAEKLAIRKIEHYQEKDVELMPGKKVCRVDAGNKTLHFEGGDSLKYDKVLFSTGGRPKVLDLPGGDLSGIYQLRSVDDGNRVSGCAKDKKVVIIGTSFIGLEVAAYMLDKGGATDVTLVGRSEIPLKMVLGDKVGIVVRKLLEDKGAKFVFSNPPKEFVGADGSLKAVVLQDGTRLDTNICIVGAGVEPSTEYLVDTAVERNTQGYITVNKQMLSTLPDVYAAGDITRFPLFLAGDDLVNIQHWQMAIQQGRIAGLNMAGKATDIKSVPFFWTMILGKGVRYAGHGHGHDDVIIHGKLEELKFIAYYTKGPDVVAVATMGSDPVAAQAAEMFYNRIPFTKQEVQSNTSDPPAWTEKLAQFH